MALAAALLPSLPLAAAQVVDARATLGGGSAVRPSPERRELLTDSCEGHCVTSPCSEEGSTCATLDCESLRATMAQYIGPTDAQAIDCCQDEVAITVMRKGQPWTVRFSGGAQPDGTGCAPTTPPPPPPLPPVPTPGPSCEGIDVGGVEWVPTPCYCPGGAKDIAECSGEGLVPYHNNLGGLGPDNGYASAAHPHPREMRYHEMGRIRGTGQLVDIAVYNQSAWSAYTTRGHGCVGAFFQFKMATESEVKLAIEMEDSTTRQPVRLRTFAMSFYDFDSKYDQTEELRIGGFVEGEFVQPSGPAVAYPIVGSNIDVAECSAEDIAYLGLPCKVGSRACSRPACSVDRVVAPIRPPSTMAGTSRQP